MKPEAPESRAPAGATDFNDLHQTGGLDAVRRSVEAAMAAPPATPAATPAPDAVAESWPAPQSLGHELTAPEPYPLDALPPALREAVAEVVDFVKCPVSLAACSALAVLSLSVQGLVNVRRDAGLEGPVNLYLLAVAESGERKSQCDKLLSAPLSVWEKRQREAAAPKLKDYAAAHEAWKQSKSGLLAAIKGAAQKSRPTASFQEQLRELERAEPEKPMIPELLHQDATPEGLAWGLKRWPSVGILSSEAGVVLGGHGMGKDSVMRNLGMMNQIWDGGQTKLTRRNEENTLHLTGRRLTIGLAVQPATLEAFFEQSEGLARGTGFNARFLLALPESTQGTRFFQSAPAEWPHLTAFHHRITALLDLPLPMGEDGELNPAMLELTPEAKGAWVAAHDQVEAELRPGGDLELIRDIASKAADNVVRLAALFHVLEHGPAAAVGIDAMNRAITVIVWHLTEARRYFGEHAMPKLMLHAQRLDNWLIGWCRENGTDSIPSRELQRMGPNCLRSRAALDEALAELLDANRVRVITEGKQKRVAVNPALLREG